MISKDDIIAMADTPEQKKFWDIEDEVIKAGDQPAKVIEQEHDGMEIIND